ncbi:unnamed protein product, partial [Symbiodinium microadriaticum]
RQRIEVNGVFDRSDSPSLRQDVEAGTGPPQVISNAGIYQCYMRREEFNTADGRYGLQSSCIVDYSYPGAGFYGPIGRGTWSAEFEATFDEQTGMLASMQDGGACQAGDPYIEPDATAARNDLFGNAFGSTTTYRGCPSLLV